MTNAGSVTTFLTVLSLLTACASPPPIVIPEPEIIEVPKLIKVQVPAEFLLPCPITALPECIGDPCDFSPYDMGRLAAKKQIEQETCNLKFRTIEIWQETNDPE